MFFNKILSTTEHSNQEQGAYYNSVKLNKIPADFQLLNGNADCNDSTNNKLQINALVPIMLPIHHLYSGQNKTATLSTRSLK